MADKRLTAVFKGTVQGVGFRYTTVGIARQFSVTGHVKNLMDGSVELVAEGEEAELQKFLKAIQTSQLSPYIRDTAASWDDARSDFRQFGIAF